MIPSQEHQNKLPEIKENIDTVYEYWSENYRRFNEFRRFALVQTLNENEISMQESMGFPTLEFNICEPTLSKLLGEMTEQDPAVNVETDNENDIDSKMLNFIEMNVRHEISNPDSLPMRKQGMLDQLSGGWAVLKIMTEYANEKSFNQVIVPSRANPLLCGFDPMAQLQDKRDGEFCFEMIPLTEKEFKRTYKSINVENLSYNQSIGGFTWSFKAQKQKIIVVCDYYWKKIKKLKLVRLVTEHVMTKDKYNEIIEGWDAIEEPPAIAEERMTEVETIWRYRLIENKIIEVEETDYDRFPLIFVDGNSVVVSRTEYSDFEQITKPLLYNAMGAQKLKNYSGNATANYIENTVQHKFILKKEAIDPQFLDPFQNMQNASNIVVSGFYKDSAGVMQPIPDPIREVIPIPAPPELLQTFMASDALMQNVLGAYDSAQGRQVNNVASGIAMVESNLSSFANCKPYVDNWMLGVQSWAEAYVTLLPKYFVTPRTVPVKDEDGKRSYQKINYPKVDDQGQPLPHNDESIDLAYEPNDLNVKISAGANFKVQKQKALEGIIQLSAANPGIAEFFATKGLPILFDNMTIRGSDQIKELSKAYMQEKAQEKQMMMQMQQQQMQNNPMVIKNQLEQAKLQQDGQLEQAKMAQDAEESEAQHAIDMAKIDLEYAKLEAEQKQLQVDSAVKIADMGVRLKGFKTESEMKRRQMSHEHFHDLATLHHEIHKPEPVKGASA